MTETPKKLTFPPSFERRIKELAKEHGRPIPREFTVEDLRKAVELLRHHHPKSETTKLADAITGEQEHAGDIAGLTAEQLESELLRTGIDPAQLLKMLRNKDGKAE